MSVFFRKVTFLILFGPGKNIIWFALGCLSIGHSFAQNPADVCASAIPITPTLVCTANAYSLPGTYAYDGLSPSCLTGSNQDDGWYTFTAQTTNYTFLLNGDYTHTAAVYSGSCGALVAVACANATAGNNATVQFITIPNATYYIQVQRNAGTSTVSMNGNFSLCYTAAPGGIKTAIKAWYKADGNLVKTGTTVTKWNTEVGNVNFTGVYNTPIFNTGFVNFNPAVSFDGNSYLNNLNVLGSDLLSSTDNTVFLVSKVNSGGILLKWDENQTTNRLGFEASPYPAATYLRLDHPGDLNSKLGGSLGSWNVMTAATTTGTDDFIINGLTVASGTGGTNNTSLTAPLSMGGDVWSGHTTQSDISEAIFYGSTLSATDLIKVQSYLAVKYGITLGDNTHALDYYSSHGTMIWEQTSSNQNDIAGIGRDDAAGLSQLKAKSSNTDDIVTMALVDGGGTFAAPNAFSSDNAFMLWGNDNGTQPTAVANGGLTESTTELPSSILRRLSRQWVIYETGTVGNVALNMDLSTIPISGTTFYDLRLLIDLDGDGDFTTGTIKRITPSSYASGIVTFNSIDFNLGDVFTLATLVSSPGGVSTGLEIWLKASSLTSTQTNNAQLNAWYNAGSSNFDFSRIGASTPGWPRYRTSSINFNPSIEFGNWGAMISQNNAVNMRPTTNNSTSMTVFKTTQNAGTVDFWGSPNFVTTESYYTGRDYGFGMTNGQLGLKIKNGETWDATSTNTYNDNKPHVALAMRTRSGVATNPSTVTIQLDGKTDVTGTSVGDSYALDASDATCCSFKGTGIGGTSVTGSDVYSSMQYVGLLSEVIVFNNALTAANLNKVNTYLAIKYGITLGDNITSVSYTNSMSTVIWNGSNTYQNDITAIGRDDRSELDQRRSVSIEADNMVDMALVDNGGTQTSPNPFDNDREFFIIGNNNGTRIFSSVDVDGTVIINRLERVWKAQESGTVGNLMIAVNLSAVPTPISGSDLRLLVDRDNDGFADNDVTPQAADSYNAGTKTAYFTADLQNGDLFTVGTAVNPLPVEFLGIIASAEAEQNVISWQTASEFNNSHFVVQRLVHGQEWDSMGTVPGNNTSNVLHSYDFFDTHVSALPFAYYRVTQYDFDGNSEASKMVYVDRSSFVNRSNLIKMGPNPANQFLDVAIDEELFNANTYQVDILSVLGVHVFHSTLSESNTRIDLSTLSSGNYIMELMNSSGTPPVYEKIIVRHQ